MSIPQILLAALAAAANAQTLEQANRPNTLAAIEAPAVQDGKEAPPKAADDLYPLVVGHRWTYRITIDGHATTHVETVTEATTILVDDRNVDAFEITTVTGGDEDEAATHYAVSAASEVRIYEAVYSKDRVAYVLSHAFPRKAPSQSFAVRRHEGAKAYLTPPPRKSGTKVRLSGEFAHGPKKDRAREELTFIPGTGMSYQRLTFEGSSIATVTLELVSFQKANGR